MGDERVPRDVVRARVHPSVTRISGEAFVDCIKLVEVELCEGLLEIGMGAFRGCNALKTINIPSTVRVSVINAGAFHDCQQLEEVKFCEGLQEIGADTPLYHPLPKELVLWVSLCQDCGH